MAEAELSPDEHAHQPGWGTASNVFAAGLDDPEIVRLLQEHAYLRSRLRHLLLATAAAYSRRADFLSVAQRCGLAKLILMLSDQKRVMPLEDAAGSIANV